MNGMSLIEDNEFLFILDLERILHDIEGITGSSSIGQDDVFGGDFGGTVKAQERTKDNGKTVLLVDDSRLILTNTKVCLERAGYRVLTAHNGVEGQELLNKHVEGIYRKIDLVVTDVEMPKMDGITFSKWIRNNHHFSDIPIILHTSLSGRNTQEAGALVGVNGYVVKSHASELLELIGEILGIRTF